MLGAPSINVVVPEKGDIMFGMDKIEPAPSPSVARTPAVQAMTAATDDFTGKHSNSECENSSHELHKAGQATAKESESEAPEQEEKKSRPWWIWVLLGILLLAVYGKNRWSTAGATLMSMSGLT
ncbi:hypothetical protein QC763_0070370 [Podospora pseudopauciseta]|uniref:Uncharacterized protein n=1 Tax=Podospora pseudopauciseta TaxID=2093780 RepID=A0ABR0HE09_9PEZI|nr:hypothetical protein QC763_0070370 [Podospora pseudopauciseta]